MRGEQPSADWNELALMMTAGRWRAPEDLHSRLKPAKRQQVLWLEYHQLKLVADGTEATGLV